MIFWPKIADNKAGRVTHPPNPCIFTSRFYWV
jgi:hypothetical protein